MDNAHETMTRDHHPLDRMMDALKHPDRRRVLTQFHGDDRSQSRAVDELVTEDAASRSSATQFHHVHLPKLADAGYVEWNPDEGTVVRGPEFDEIEPLLRVLQENRDELPHGWP